METGRQDLLVQAARSPQVWPWQVTLDHSQPMSDRRSSLQLTQTREPSSAAGWLEVPFDTVPAPVINYLLNAQPPQTLPSQDE